MKHIFIIFFALAASLAGKAQDINYSDVTNGATVSDFGLTGGVTTDPSSGIGYQAIGGGIFEHYGPLTNGSFPGVGTLHVQGVYDATNGRDDFYGPGGAAGIQSITGNTRPTFGILNVNNGAGTRFDVLNTQGILVAGTANFSNGITTTVRSNINTGAVQFADGATYTNTAGSGAAVFPGTGDALDAQHVNGYVTKIGDDGFIYPVGSGTDYRPLQISAPATATDAYSVAWIAGDPTTTTDPSGAPALHPVTSVGPGILSVSTAGQWDWITQSGTGAGLTITVSMPNLNKPGVVQANLRLVGWNGTQWVNLSTAQGSGAANGIAENNTLAGTMIAGITAIGIGSVDLVLPVGFAAFSGKVISCNAVLTWKTATEQNSSYYAVEYSADGVHFADAGRVPSMNSIAGSTYTYTYAQMRKGANYFRIRAVDFDGHTGYTNVVPLTGNCSGAVITLSPNPAADIITISGISAKDRIIIYDAVGQQMTNVVAAGTTHSVDVSSFAKGTYFVKIMQGESEAAVLKMIKK
jgi:hypothetical protein